MKHSVNRELFAYWDRLRAGRAAPERADIDPAMIRGILADTFVLEADGQGTAPMFPIRLSGTRLNALFASELKGQSMLTLFDEGDKEALRDIMVGVLDTRIPTLAGLKSAPSGYEPVDFELLLLPLRHAGKTHARLLGAIAPFSMPSWLGLIPIAPLSLISFRFIQSATTASSGFPDRRQPGHDGRRYGYLVVHEGGRTGGPKPARPV